MCHSPPSKLLFRNALIAWALILTAPLARAAITDPAAAQMLFEEGRERLATGQFAEACAKLAESQRMDPAPGTAFNLADCYVQIGKLASAWSLFRDVEAQAKLANQPARMALARSRADELEASLPRIVVRVPSPSQGVAVRRDGVPIGTAQLDTAVPVDVGEHVISATAPGKRDWQATVVVAHAGETFAISVPPLEDAPPPILPPPPAALTRAQDVLAPAAPTRTSPLSTAALVSGVTGLAFMVASGVTVAVARSKFDAAAPSCSASACRSLDAVELRRESVTLGNVATALALASASGVATGAVLWLAAPGRAPTSPAHATIQVGLGVLQAFVRGAW